MQRIPEIPYCNSRSRVIWPLIYMAGIFCLSSISDHGIANGSLNPLGWISPDVQNFLHLPIYGGLAAIWFWGLRHWIAETGYRYLLALILTVGYGLLDEWHQSFVPGRCSSLTDVSFDLLGAVVGLVLYRSWFSVAKG